MELNRAFFASGLVGACLLLTLSGAAAQPAAAESPPDAKAILMEMAQFLSATPQFSVNMRNGYDVVQASGQKIEFNEKRTLLVRRPDRLRVEVEHSDGDKQLVLFDGKELTVLSTPQNAYAQAAKPGTIDDAVVYFLRDLQMRLPLALMLVEKLPAEFERRAESVDYVEKTSVLGVEAHHLAARAATVDFQIWITAGKQPLPLRAVLTYKTAEGAPQFWADFTDWNLAPQVTDASFAFTAPPGARKIAFLPQIAQLAPAGAIAAQPGAQAPQSTGEQQ